MLKLIAETLLIATGQYQPRNSANQRARRSEKAVKS